MTNTGQLLSAQYWSHTLHEVGKIKWPTLGYRKTIDEVCVCMYFPLRKSIQSKNKNYMFQYVYM